MKSHTVFKDTLHNGLEIEKNVNKNIYICVIYLCMWMYCINYYLKLKNIINDFKGHFFTDFFVYVISRMFSTFFLDFRAQFKVRKWKRPKRRMAHFRNLLLVFWRLVSHRFCCSASFQVEWTRFIAIVWLSCLLYSLKHLSNKSLFRIKIFMLDEIVFGF